MELKKVVIIDYNLGNLFSVKQACDTVGLNSVISSSKEDIINADALILPGVGAFNEAMKNLVDLGLDTVIKLKVNKGIPLFGVCLGLQLLFTESEEFGTGRGLDLIPGIIKKFPINLQNHPIKVPHISWNTIYKSSQNWDQTPLSNLNEDEFMYFVHSYYVIPSNKACVLTNTNYDGIEFCSSIKINNIFATQFHPEKSANNGLSIYKEWATIYNLL
tara:strand:- start:308 stop:958 length:651 start_codon:yes stop_codon:yes gene_type:complete